MDSRERTFLALDHQTPDRIPVDFWASAGFLRKLEAETGLTKAGFLDRYDVDLRYIRGPAYIGPALDGGRDIWGVPRVVAEVQVAGGVERYEEVAAAPLGGAGSVDDVERYARWPSADWFDYSGVEAQCEAVRAEGRVVVFEGDRLNRIAQLKPAMYLRGVERILMDLVESPDVARAVIGRVRRFCAGYLERILAAAGGKIDIVLTGDDFGSQQGPLVSPAMWDEFLRAGFAEYVAIAQAHGARVMHHTCGGVLPIIPKMMDCGLDVLQSLQPEAAGMDAGVLKSRFGGRLAFAGGVSVQRTMPFGDRAAIRAEVRRLAETLGVGGGYVFGTSHNVQADVAVGNVLALMDAYGEYGASRG